jgi:quinol monooxygenase YgiN
MIEKENTMIVINAFAEVMVGKEDDFLTAAQSLIEKTRQETGNQFYQLYQNNNQFVFVEYWQNQSAFDAHCKAEHFITFAEQAATLFAKPLRIESYSA